MAGNTTQPAGKRASKDSAKGAKLHFPPPPRAGDPWATRAVPKPPPVAALFPEPPKPAPPPAAKAPRVATLPAPPPRLAPAPIETIDAADVVALDEPSIIESVVAELIEDKPTPKPPAPPVDTLEVTAPPEHDDRTHPRAAPPKPVRPVRREPAVRRPRPCDLSSTFESLPPVAGRPKWWAYTTASAIASALVCMMGLGIFGNDDAAVVEPEREQVLITYDASLLTEDAGQRGEPASDDLTEREREELARRISLRARRNLEAGRVAYAKKIYEEALSHNGDSRVALAGLGKIHLRRKHYRRAVSALERAVEIEPRDAENQLMLGDAYRGLGRLDKARTHYHRAKRRGHPEAASRLSAL